VGQAWTCAKLHRTNRDNRNDFSRSPTHVRRIGQGASKPSDITGRLCPFGDSVKLVSRLAHPTARLRMVPIEFVVYQLAASVSDRIPRVKTCNVPYFSPARHSTCTERCWEAKLGESTHARPWGLISASSCRGDVIRLMAWILGRIPRSCVRCSRTSYEDS